MTDVCESSPSILFGAETSIQGFLIELSFIWIHLSQALDAKFLVTRLSMSVVASTPFTLTICFHSAY